jgi:hypothetical protein
MVGRAEQTPFGKASWSPFGRARLGSSNNVILVIWELRCNKSSNYLDSVALLETIVHVDRPMDMSAFLGFELCALASGFERRTVRAHESRSAGSGSPSIRPALHRYERKDFSLELAECSVRGGLQ